MPHIHIPKYTSEEALGRILSYLRGGRRHLQPTESAGVSYDLYIPEVIRYCSLDQQTELRQQNPQGMISISVDTNHNAEPFYDAAWGLCTRGILRPGAVFPSTNFERAPVIGACFFLTDYGKKWLQNPKPQRRQPNGVCPVCPTLVAPQRPLWRRIPAAGVRGSALLRRAYVLRLLRDVWRRRRVRSPRTRHRQDWGSRSATHPPTIWRAR
jgi:hypothetical protein